MNPIKIECPHCQQHIETPPDMAGQVVRCPTCEKPFVAPKRPLPEWVPSLAILLAGIGLYELGTRSEDYYGSLRTGEDIVLGLT
ncbi:MAG: hypothetical protein ACLQU4_03520 [Limisphaerales bacterium]